VVQVRCLAPADGKHVPSASCAVEVVAFAAADIEALLGYGLQAAAEASFNQKLLEAVKVGQVRDPRRSRIRGGSKLELLRLNMLVPCVCMSAHAAACSHAVVVSSAENQMLIFANLTSEQRDWLAEQMVEQTFAPGEGLQGSHTVHAHPRYLKPRLTQCTHAPRYSCTLLTHSSHSARTPTASTAPFSLCAGCNVGGTGEVVFKENAEARRPTRLTQYPHSPLHPCTLLTVACVLLCVWCVWCVCGVCLVCVWCAGGVGVHCEARQGVGHDQGGRQGG
jgi:hypothetical protein